MTFLSLSLSLFVKVAAGLLGKELMFVQLPHVTLTIESFYMETNRVEQRKRKKEKETLV